MVGAAGTEAAARELSKLAMIVLEAPAAVVIVDGVGEGIHMEAGDTAGHPIADPGSLMQVLSDNGVALGSIAVSARPGRPYGEHDLRVLTALAGQMSFVLHRLALFEGVRMERAALADVIASSSDGIFSVDSDQVIRSWNESMERLTNIPAAAAIGQPCCATFRPFDEEGDPLYDATCPGRKGAPVEVLAQLPAARRGRAE